MNSKRCIALCLGLLPALSCLAGPAAEALPVARMIAGHSATAPVPNAAFAPAADALGAPAFEGTLRIAPAELLVAPALDKRVVDGRDAQAFPGVSLQFLTLEDGTLVPLERGTMVTGSSAGKTASYWNVIPQFGRVWREKDDGEWSRAAFPLMLVNDTENHAHQGLATFLYRGAEVSALQLQFVQQNAPYLLSPYCQFWGAARATFTNTEVQNSAAQREAAKQELAARLPAEPLAALRKTLPAGTLDGLGGPVLPQWQVALGLVHEGTLYYEGGDTPQGAYPYPLEMRFGVRSVTKSVGAPLSLLRLAQVYGPYVLELKIGDYVPGLDPKWNRIRFIDAANMASGFGGVGSFVTHPNDDNEGYLLADYDGWYTAPSHAQKLAHINTHLKPYPWEPGTVMRYRDQDFYLLGAAVDAFLKSVRGPQADAWHMLEEEVFTPIGIAHAPMVRTREPDGREGLAWFNAGYYPTLDDLAKIALLMADKGEHNGVQILHRGLTEDLLAARGALDKDGDAARPADRAAGAPPPRLYRMGYHYTAWTGTRSGQLLQLPTMSGFGDNEVIIFPGRTIAIRAAKAVTWKGGPVVHSDDPLATARAVDRLAPL
jgi:hypothetical protein